MNWLNELNWGAIATDGLLLIGKLVLAFLAFYVARAIGRKVISQSFVKMKKQRNISAGRSHTLEKLAVNVLSYVLIFILVTFIAEMFGFSPSALIAGAGVIGLAVGFGAQGLVSDVVTGFFLLLEKQVDVGDYVTVAGLDGIVEEVGLRTTQIRGFDGTLYFIPNRNITDVHNHSRGNMRALVDVSIPFEDNMDETIKVIQDACADLGDVKELIKEGPDVVGVEDLSSSLVTIRVIAKTENMHQWTVERKIRQVIKQAMDEYKQSQEDDTANEKDE
ncbi:mechanosensitive ion channel family protein [Alkalicoccobacillus murimartini]|uniref:Small conductance mechanosensitive channel n=1 Tax=Alkalicoccobacillus murimartini TaxID=171685 RepID=A0ABT9YF93_9BACI|nr:mechanosensitive ion channel domain-containing protein [Alkalicoccobacillus murimartini]MDQ0206512.1 small conductance mechanosensitive channel [Alkalicoccobacillus murimartini]